MTNLSPAKPGMYVFDYDANQFVGKLNKDGTENRTWTAGGACSFLNTLLEASGGYTPKNPNSFAAGLLGAAKNGYVVQGYSLAVATYIIDKDDWSPALEAELSEPISEIFTHLSRADEGKAKLEHLSSVFRTEISKRRLANLSEVTEADALLLESQKRSARESALNYGFQRLRELDHRTAWQLIHERASDGKVADWATKSTHTALRGKRTVYEPLYNPANPSKLKAARKALIDWAADNKPLYVFLTEEWKPLSEDLDQGTIRRKLIQEWPVEMAGWYFTKQHSSGRAARKDSVFLKNCLWARFQARKCSGTVKEYLELYLSFVNGGFLSLPYDEWLQNLFDYTRRKLRGKGVMVEYDGLPSYVLRIFTWSEFLDIIRKWDPPQEVLNFHSPYNRR